MGHPGAAADPGAIGKGNAKRSAMMPSSGLTRDLAILAELERKVLWLASYGWTAVNEVVFPVVVVAGLLLAWGTLARRPTLV